MSIWTDHPRATDNPQGYWAHAAFAGRNSLIIIFAGLVGLIHAAFPFLFPFFTSTVVIRSFKKLVDSRRHEPELRREVPDYSWSPHCPGVFHPLGGEASEWLLVESHSTGGAG